MADCFVQTATLMHILRRFRPHRRTALPDIRLRTRCRVSRTVLTTTTPRTRHSTQARYHAQQPARAATMTAREVLTLKMTRLLQG
jgi:hypothetical protein